MLFHLNHEDGDGDDADEEDEGDGLHSAHCWDFMLRCWFQRVEKACKIKFKYTGRSARDQIQIQVQIQIQIKVQDQIQIYGKKRKRSNTRQNTNTNTSQWEDKWLRSNKSEMICFLLKREDFNFAIGYYRNLGVIHLLVSDLNDDCVCCFLAKVSYGGGSRTINSNVEAFLDQFLLLSLCWQESGGD